MTQHRWRKAALAAAVVAASPIAALNAQTPPPPGAPTAQATPMPNAQVAQVAQGRKVYAQWCVACHGAGQHTPGTMALHFKYEGSQSPLLEQRPGLTADFLRIFIRNGVSVMPSFRRTEVSDPDIDALAAYLAHTAAQAAPAKPATAPQ